MEAIEGYLQTKSVWINTGSGGGNPFSMETAGARAAAALIAGAMNASPAPFFPKRHGLRVHQRETKVVAEDGRGTDDECRACGRALDCDSLGCCLEASCWAGVGGAGDTFCLTSSSIAACSTAMFCANCSCLAAN